MGAQVTPRNAMAINVRITTATWKIPKYLEQMRADWNQRASEDAYYYVAFGRRDQEDDEFFSSADEIVKAFELDIEARCRPRGRARNRLRTRPPDAAAGEALRRNPRRRCLRRDDPPGAANASRDTPNAFPHHGTGSDLCRSFADEKFDFVYSYAVFQHIPSRDVVFNYLREARRVLKTGGILRCQLNGLPPTAKQYDTWSGVRITPRGDLRLRARARFPTAGDRTDLDAVHVDHLPQACRRAGARMVSAPTGQSTHPQDQQRAHRRIGGARRRSAGRAVALGSQSARRLRFAQHQGAGRRRRVPPHLHRPAAEGRHHSGQRRAARWHPHRAWCRSKCSGTTSRCAAPAWVRIMPAGPSVPRITTITDGVNLLSGTRIVTRTREGDHDRSAARRDLPAPPSTEYDALEIDAFCADPVTLRYEFNFKLPERIGRGTARGGGEAR